jgi:hypothetical protein
VELSLSSAVGGNFHASIPKILFETNMRSRFYWTNYAPSADGQRLLIAVPVEAAQPMTVVLNWMAGLKK